MPMFRSLAPAALPLLAACSTVSGQGHTAAVGQSFTLRPGNSVAVADAGTLRYDALVNDSRCAPNVQCIWAGDAELAFTWSPRSGAAERFSLHTKPDAGRHALADRRQVRLVSLERGDAPAATVLIEPTP